MTQVIRLRYPPLPVPPRSRALQAPLALWLVPAAVDAAPFAKIIATLARRFDGPAFAPHVTVLSGFAASPPALLPVLQRVAAEVGPFSLTPAGCGHSPQRFQACYWRFDEAAPVHALRERLAPLLGVPAATAPHPHLSLLYQLLPAVDREALCRDLPALGAIQLAGLELIAPAPGAVDWADVAGWRSLGSVPLGGPG